MLELIVIRLQLVVSDAPVLAGAVLRDLLLAIALYRSAAGLKVPWQKTMGYAAPVHARAAHAFAGLERADLAHRQRGLVHRVAECERLARQVLDQIAMTPELEFVVRIRHRKIVI